MHDVEQKLTKCFSAVLPELSPEEIRRSTPNTTGDWDSLTVVTVMALIQEEFGVDLDVCDMAENFSFDSVLSRLTEARGAEFRPSLGTNSQD
jgi:acyl carrier protein